MNKSGIIVGGIGILGTYFAITSGSVGHVAFWSFCTGVSLTISIGGEYLCRQLESVIRQSEEEPDDED